MDIAIINTIRNYFASQPVDKAWIFGSFSRGEERPDSDIDLLVQYTDTSKVSLLRHAAMALDLERLLHRAVDLVTDGTLLPYAELSANNDKILVYERNR